MHARVLVRCIRCISCRSGCFVSCKMDVVGRGVEKQAKRKRQAPILRPVVAVSPLFSSLHSSLLPGACVFFVSSGAFSLVRV